MNKFLFLFFISFNSFCSEFIIKAKGYVDVTNGKIHSGQYIYVKDNLISKISSSLPKDTKGLLDLGQSYILPGLIDSHSHVFMTQTLEDKTFQNALLREARLSDDLRYRRAKSFLQQYLEEGFTSIFDLGNSGHFLDAKMKKEIENDFHYPMLFISGPGIAHLKGQFDQGAKQNLAEKEYTLINSTTAIDPILKTYLDNGVDILKIYLDNIPSNGEMDEKDLQKILSSKYIQLFKKVTFHSISPNGAILLSKYQLKNIEHFNYYSLALKNNFLQFATPTDLTKETLKEFNEYHPVTYLSQISRTRLLKDSSIKILFGPDFYFYSTERLLNRAQYIKNSIDAFSEAGLTPIQIIQSMTINPARSIGFQNKIGQIKIGAYANLIATTTNPTLNINSIKNISFIMNQGKVIRAPQSVNPGVSAKTGASR